MHSTLIQLRIFVLPYSPENDNDDSENMKLNIIYYIDLNLNEWKIINVTAGAVPHQLPLNYISVNNKVIAFCVTLSLVYIFDTGKNNIKQ